MMLSAHGVAFVVLSLSGFHTSASHADAGVPHTGLLPGNHGETNPLAEAGPGSSLQTDAPAGVIIHADAVVQGGPDAAGNATREPDTASPPAENPPKKDRYGEWGWEIDLIIFKILQILGLSLA